MCKYPDFLQKHSFVSEKEIMTIHRLQEKLLDQKSKFRKQIQFIICLIIILKKGKNNCKLRIIYFFFNYITQCVITSFIFTI